MKSYIIGILCVLILVSLFYYSKVEEPFSNYNIIQNGNFNNGTDISNMISKENNFSIISFENPDNLSHVLKQSSFNNKGYNISLDIPKNTNYVLSYWLGSDNEYNGTNNTVEIIGDSERIRNTTKVTNTQTINNVNWKQIETKFNSSKNKKIKLNIGKTGSFSNGFRLYSDFVLNAHLDNISDFYFLNKLIAFFVVNKNSEGNFIKSEVNNHTIQFQNPLNISNDLLSLKDNYGQLPDSNKIFPNNTFNNEFSIMFSYKGEEYDNGSLLRIDAVNDINSGIEIDIKYNTGIDNTLIVTIGGLRNTFNVGITNKLVNYFVTYNRNKTRLYIDGAEINAVTIEKIVETQNLGTCPDGWLYEGNNKCVNKSNKNVGSCGNFAKFNNKNNKNKLKWSEKCNVVWKNCAILDKNNTAPNNETSCKQNTKLHFANVPAKLNNDSNLKGSLKALLIYNKELSSQDVVGINKYFIVKGSMLSLDNICNRPVMVRDSIDKDIVSTPNTDSDCPFNDNRICRSAECSCVNWTTLSNVSQQCKLTVNAYCKNNYDDKKCVDLRNRKCKKISDESKVKKQVDNNELLILKNEIANLKKQQVSEKDCTNCDNKIDLSKYVKKDNIPCWGCKL